ncbi:MAG TPA: hypothetical protein VMX13_12990, partial [Sedimentisphaerales bacterium]|nr:hypothetical protein [Sedimentisphaerales bacterium]
LSASGGILVSCVLRLLRSISVENPLQIRPFRAKQTQFPKHSKSAQTQALQRITKMKALRQDPKTNPKRTQFFARQGPSNPKRTQTNPIFQKTQKTTQPQFQQTLMKMKPLSALTRTNSKPSGDPYG